MKRAKRGVSVLLAILLVVSGIAGHTPSVFAATGTTESTVENEGDTSTSPLDIKSYWGTAAIDGRGCLTGDDGGTSRFFRLSLGTGSKHRDVYCGNYGLHASGNVTYAATLAEAGTTKIGGVTMSNATYNIIRAVVTANRAAAVTNNTDKVHDATYTAGQLTVWRALYLCSQDAGTYNKSSFINGKMTALIEQLAAQINPANPAQTASEIEDQIGDYLTAAKDGTYAKYKLWVWNDGDPADQLLFSGDYVLVREEHGYVELTKTSSYNGEWIGGATYGVYTSRNCSAASKVDEFTTNANGYGKSNVLTTKRAGETDYIHFWVKEISLEDDNYKVNTKTYGGNDGFTIKSDGATYTLGTAEDDKVQDDPISATVYVYKLNSENKPTATGTNSSGGKEYTDDDLKKVALSGATFVVKQWSKSKNKYVSYETMTYASSTKRYHVTLNYTKDNEGKFSIEETKAPAGYIKSDEIKYFNLSKSSVQLEGFANVRADGSRRVLYYDNPICGSATVSKKDAGTGTILSGATFALQEWNGTDYVFKKNLTYNSSTKEYETGLLDWTETNQGKFKIIEAKPQYKYYLGRYSQTFTLTKYNQTFTFTATNTPVKVNVSVQKKDADLNRFASQGDADITKTIIGLYAAETIKSADGKTTYYEKDEKIGQKNVDSAGKAEWSDLPLGNYYAKEVEAGPGYVGDYDTKYPLNAENNYKANYDVTLTIASASTTIPNTVIKRPFAIQKLKDFVSDSEEEEALAGAGFTAYLKSAIPLNPDGTYNFAAAEPVVIGADGETEIFTDENGYAESIPILYGTYVIVETTTPHNYRAVPPFEVIISENSTEPDQIIQVKDKEFGVRLQVIKMDSESKRSILRANTEFKIRDTSTMEYVTQNGNDSFYTDELGILNLAYPLRPGNYVLEEHLAPYGYVLNTEYLPITVDEDNYDNLDPETMLMELVIEYYDEPVTGSLQLIKTGEVLVGYQEGKFIYEPQGLADAVYELHAAEDIYTPDGQFHEAEDKDMPNDQSDSAEDKDTSGDQPDAEKERDRYYAKDELVAELITDEEGKAFIEKLPLGSYYLIETQAPQGFVLDPEPVYVTLAYADQTIPVVSEEISVIDERYKIKLSLIKHDKEHSEIVLPGAIYGLYAAESIIDIYGNELLQVDELIETAVTDEDGVALYQSDLHPGKYYLIEIEAPEGYLIDDQPINIEFDQDQEYDIVIHATDRKGKEEGALKPPSTGDTFPILLVIALPISIAMVFCTRRKRGKA